MWPKVVNAAAGSFNNPEQDVTAITALLSMVYPVDILSLHLRAVLTDHPWCPVYG